MADTGAVPVADAKEFEFFYEILNAFRDAAASAEDGDFTTMKTDLFLNAMTMFLRIFDAFANPFFAEVVKKDVQGNITKLQGAAAKREAKTLVACLDSEGADAKLVKLMKKESGAGNETGTVGLLWMKRMMQFVTGMLEHLMADPASTLSGASRASYAKTLRYCHNFVTRGVFDTGLRFVPAREVFFKNLGHGAPPEKVDEALKEFITIFSPMLKSIDSMYKKRELEPLIP